MSLKLELQNVHKSFPTRNGVLQVVGGVNVGIAEGEFVAIIGPSGCGKSTLMNLIAGFETPDTGAVLVDGKVRQGPNENGVLITQSGSVFPWLNVQQNLMFGLKDNVPDKVAHANRYAALVGLKGFEFSYPHELSGGMLKRAEIARALAVRPDIVFMDEPFSALDALMNLRMRTEFLRILEQERHTVILITHDVEEAVYMADRVLVLSPRPTRIQASYDIKLPHPRAITSPAAQALRVTLLKELGVVHDSLATVP
jgi:ABC-type nitrate/sulfonate/bicarbonate transport system ATPase subunit